MMRLVQGDVGSGKTAVAAAAIYFAVKNGCQAAMMAPTEVLAAQHYRSLSALLAPFGFRVELLSGSLTKAQKNDVHSRLQSGEIDVAVGTNALIQPGVHYRRLGLAVTDEQHRFGVIQRAALVNKSTEEDAAGPQTHTLVMSATPIPRTLSLILYGDLDVSVLDEMPPGRMKVDTFLVDGSYRARIEAFIRKQLDAGRQAFIVCPLVEENGESDDKKAVTEYAERIRPTFAPYAVGCVHGRQKPAEKDRVMAAFAAGELHILVSTTVVEVGVDVPNASVMLIENAECFGLSQLHQLRGRVGRGRHKSYCILLSGQPQRKIALAAEDYDRNRRRASKSPTPTSPSAGRAISSARARAASCASNALRSRTWRSSARPAHSATASGTAPLRPTRRMRPCAAPARERLEAEAARNTLN